MFCVNCGTNLPEGSNFCPSCGTAAKLPGAAPLPQTTPFEQIAPPPQTAIWVLSATRKLGVFKAVACSVVFMRDRLVLAHLTPELQKAESARLARERKARGDGFFKAAAASLSFWSSFSEKYASMNEALILAEDKTNISVPYAAITGVFFSCYSESTSYDENSNTTSSGGKLEIALAGDTIKFTHKQHHSRELKAMLESFFGLRLKYKK